VSRGRSATETGAASAASRRWNGAFSRRNNPSTAQALAQLSQLQSAATTLARRGRLSHAQEDRPDALWGDATCSTHAGLPVPRIDAMVRSGRASLAWDGVLVRRAVWSQGGRHSQDGGSRPSASLGRCRASLAWEGVLARRVVPFAGGTHGDARRDWCLRGWSRDLHGHTAVRSISGI
jgi:hypothetical protein